MGKVVAALLSAIAVLFGPVVGGSAVWWFDHRPLGDPPSFRVGFWFLHKDVGLPPSLAARLHTAETAFQAQLAAASARARAGQGQADVAVAAAAAPGIVAQQAIRDRQAAFRKEIPGVLTPALDRSFPLSVGFVRAHDAAAAGAVLPAVSPDGRRDDEASAVAPSWYTAVVSENYTDCRLYAARLISFQDQVDAFNAAVTDLNTGRNPDPVNVRK